MQQKWKIGAPKKRKIGTPVEPGPIFRKIYQKIEKVQKKASSTNRGARFARPQPGFAGLFLPVFHFFANFVKKWS